MFLITEKEIKRIIDEEVMSLVMEAVMLNEVEEGEKSRKSNAPHNYVKPAGQGRKGVLRATQADGQRMRLYDPNAKTAVLASPNGDHEWLKGVMSGAHLKRHEGDTEKIKQIEKDFLGFSVDEKFAENPGGIRSQLKRGMADDEAAAATALYFEEAYKSYRGMFHKGGEPELLYPEAEFNKEKEGYKDPEAAEDKPEGGAEEAPQPEEKPAEPAPTPAPVDAEEEEVPAETPSAAEEPKPKKSPQLRQMTYGGGGGYGSTRTQYSPTPPTAAKKSDEEESPAKKEAKRLHKEDYPEFKKRAEAAIWPFEALEGFELRFAAGEGEDAGPQLKYNKALEKKREKADADSERNLKKTKDSIKLSLRKVTALLARSSQVKGIPARVKKLRDERASLQRQWAAAPVNYVIELAINAAIYENEERQYAAETKIAKMIGWGWNEAGEDMQLSNTKTYDAKARNLEYKEKAAEEAAKAEEAPEPTSTPEEAVNENEQGQEEATWDQGEWNYTIHGRFNTGSDAFKKYTKIKQKQAKGRTGEVEKDDSFLGRLKGKFAKLTGPSKEDTEKEAERQALLAKIKESPFKTERVLVARSLVGDTSVTDALANKRKAAEITRRGFEQARGTAAKKSAS